MSVKTLRSGRRVPEGLLDMAQLIETELKLVGKIDRFFAVNALPLLIDESDIRQAIGEMRALNDEYVDIHTKLKTDLEVDYNDSYPNYEDRLNSITDYITAAVAEIKCRREKQVQAGVRGFRAPQIMPATGGGGPVRVWGRKLPIEP